MKSYQSTVKVESQLPDWQGVSFTVRRLSEGLRLAVNERLGPQIEKMRDLVSEANALMPKVQDGSPDEATVSRLGFVANSIGLVRSAINRAYAEAGVTKIEGLEIDGAPATIRSLIESGPRELYAEALEVALREAGMTEQEKKNLESPITSGAAVDGRTSGTTAGTAEPMDSTQTATAGSISLAR